MLTAKELSAIEEQLKAEKLLITKNKANAQLCDDPEAAEKSASKWPQNMRSICQTPLSLLD